MALFKKEEKKLTLDDILKGLEDLPEEDRAKVKAKMDDLYKAEDEREIDKIEEDKAEPIELEDDKKKDVAEESEEIAKDVDEVEAEVETDEKKEDAPVEPVDVVEPTEDAEGIEHEKEEKETYDKIASRVAELEKFRSEIQPLVELMQDYTTKQAKKFGYEGAIPGSKKDYRDMDSDELAKSLRTEI
jgi:hypothetical protein